MYEGYFTDYPDDEELPEDEIPVVDLMSQDKKAMEEAAQRKNIFERMVLANVQEEHGEEMAAYIEYFAAASGGGGFWNDPILQGNNLTEDLAEKVAERAVMNYRDHRVEMDTDEDYILEKAGLAE